MGRFELKIISTVLLVGLGALVAGALLFKRVVRDTLAVGVNPTTLESLQFALDTARAYTRTKRQSFELLQESLAGNQALGRAIDDGDRQRVRTFLAGFVERHEAIESIRIELRGPQETSYREFARVSRSAPSHDADYRFYPFTREIRSASGKSIRYLVRFRFPTAFSKKLAATARWHRTYQALYEDIYRRERLFAERYSTSYIVLFTLVLVLLLVASVLITRSFTRRIAGLVAATRDVGAGNLEVELRPGSDDELGDLIVAFNRMVAELRGSRQRIAYLDKVSGWQDIARRLAHEIKNPLTPILLAAQQLQKKYEGDDPRFRKLLDDSSEIIQEEIDGLRRLVNEFSEFAKLPSASLNEEEPVAFVEDFLRRHERFADRCALEWAHSGETDVRIALDRVLLQRVLVNLIENAAQASPVSDEGALPRVELRTWATDERFRLEVVDHGNGVGVADRERIFDPYYTTKSAGTGLGLSIVKKIVLEHGGTIAVEDADTGGACFRIELPLSSARADRRSEGRASSSA